MSVKGVGPVMRRLAISSETHHPLASDFNRQDQGNAVTVVIILVLWTEGLEKVKHRNDRFTHLPLDLPSSRAECSFALLILKASF